MFLGLGAFELNDESYEIYTSKSMLSTVSEASMYFRPVFGRQIYAFIPFRVIGSMATVSFINSVLWFRGAFTSFFEHWRLFIRNTCIDAEYDPPFFIIEFPDLKTVSFLDAFLAIREFTGIP